MKGNSPHFFELESEQMKRSRTLFAISILFVICSCSFIVNHYVFSWTGFILNKIGLCECKSIRSQDDKSGYKILSYTVDLSAIDQSLGTNPSYNLIFHRDYTLVVSRTFGDVTYSINLYNWTNWTEKTMLSLNTYPKGPSQRNGETCTTPAYIVERNIYLMIDDLPLTEPQKTELRRSVIVSNQIELNMWIG
jgi:hypothetical protein